MKRIAITTLVLLFAVSFSFAQSRTELKGPAAKNYKPWLNKEKSSNVYQVKLNQDLKGPEAKNAKVWSEESRNAPSVVLNMESTPNKLKGPEAKNRKIWEDNDASSDLQLANSTD